MKQNQSEYDLSKELYSMLCEIIKKEGKGPESEKIIHIDVVKKFILSNYEKPLSLSELAAARPT